MQETVSLLKQLISVGSPSGNEEAMAGYVSDYLRDEGFSPRIETFHSSNGVDYHNVICHSGSGTNRIALNSHMDTVGVVDGWQTAPLTVTESGSKLFGLGAADMKAGLAMQLNTFIQLADSYPLLLTVVSDEELISRGTNFLVDRGVYKGCSAAIFSEPSPEPRSENDYELRLGGRGRYVFEVEVRTSGGHGSRSKKTNSIVEASRFMQAVHEFHTAEHPLMGSARYNIESISGGVSGFLSVPSRCTMQVSRSVIDGETIDGIRSELERMVAGVSDNAAVSVRTLARETPFCEPYICDVNELIVACAKKAFREQGITPRITAPSVYDISIVGRRAGVPSINIGPIGGNIHQAGEFVYRHSIATAEKTLSRTIELFNQQV